jgi:hypothetical protein
VATNLENIKPLTFLYLGNILNVSGKLFYLKQLFIKTSFIIESNKNSLLRPSEDKKILDLNNRKKANVL